MDGQTPNMGNGPDAVGHRSDALNRIARGVPPMRPLFGGKDAIDRKLLRGVVKAFAGVRGVDYETAHKMLTDRAISRWGFIAPEHTPLSMLRQRQREVYCALAKAREQRKLDVDRFVGDDDGKGESPDPLGVPPASLPDLSSADLARSQRVSI